MTDNAPTIVPIIDITGPGDVNCFFDIAQALPLTNDRNLAIIKGSGWGSIKTVQCPLSHSQVFMLKSMPDDNCNNPGIFKNFT